jgi:hypothetical protein
MEHLSNNAVSSLPASISPTATTIIVQNVSAFPEPVFRILIDNELMRVTGIDRPSRTLTVERGTEGTDNVAHSQNATVAVVVTAAGLLAAIEQSLIELGTVHWDDVTDKPSFVTVATSGSYNDLSDQPSIPTDISELTDDVGLVTSDDLPTDLSQLNNDVAYVQAETTLPNANIMIGGTQNGSTIRDSGIAFPLDATNTQQIGGLATVATSGSYIHLSDRPEVPIIAATLNILVGDNAGGAANSGYAFPLDATDPSQITGTGNPFDQELSTTDSPTFVNVTATSYTGSLNMTGPSGGVLLNSAGVAETDGATTLDGAGNLVVASLVAAGFIYPVTDGTNGQALKTDGAGNLTFGDAGGNPFDQDLNQAAEPEFSNLTVNGKHVVRTDTDSVTSTNIPAFADATGTLLADSGYSFPLDARDLGQIVNASPYRGEIENGQTYNFGDIVKESNLTAMCVASITTASTDDWPSGNTTNWRLIPKIDRTSNILIGDPYGNAIDSGFASIPSAVSELSNDANYAIAEDYLLFSGIVVGGTGSTNKLKDSGFSFPLDASDPAQISNVPQFDQDLNTGDTPTFAGIIVGSLTYPNTLGTAGQFIGSNGAGLEWQDHPNMPNIAETTNILMGDDNGNAVDAGFSSDGSGNITTTSVTVTDGPLDIDGAEGLNIDGTNVLTQDETFGIRIDPIANDSNLWLFQRRSGAIIIGTGGGVASISSIGVLSGFTTNAVDGSGIYNIPLGAISSGDFLQRIVTDAGVGDGEYKIVVSSGVASLVAI